MHPSLSVFSHAGRERCLPGVFLVYLLQPRRVLILPTPHLSLRSLICCSSLWLSLGKKERESAHLRGCCFSSAFTAAVLRKGCCFRVSLRLTTSISSRAWWPSINREWVRLCLGFILEITIHSQSSSFIPHDGCKENFATFFGINHHSTRRI